MLPMNTAFKRCLPVPDRCPAEWLKFWGCARLHSTPGPTTVHYGGNTSCVEVPPMARFIISMPARGGLLGCQLVAEFDAQALDLTLLLTHSTGTTSRVCRFFSRFTSRRTTCASSAMKAAPWPGSRAGRPDGKPFFRLACAKCSQFLIEELKEMSFNVGRCACKPASLNTPGNASATACSPPTVPSHSSPTMNCIISCERYATCSTSSRDRRADHGLAVLMPRSISSTPAGATACLDDVGRAGSPVGSEKSSFCSSRPNHDDAKIPNAGLTPANSSPLERQASGRSAVKG